MAAGEAEEEEAGVSQQREQRAPTPALVFAIPAKTAASEGPAAPSQTATEDRGAAAKQGSGAAPGQADPRAVADRVYELMREEMEHSVLRGMRRRGW